MVTPGNAGIAAHGIACVNDLATDLEADLFVIGPEQPLVEGLADNLRLQGKRVVGPGADGAQLEGSKAYMKDFLASASVPTARYGTFSELGSALRYLGTMTAPYVVKTDGLAAGKGVLVTHDLDEAANDVRDKLSGSSFGPAGTTVIIEEGLDGRECSLIVLCDGLNVVALAPAQDFKRVGDADQGANTGGMGAYAPMNSMSPDQIDSVMRDIVSPTIEELRHRGIDYRGVLYAGVMLGAEGPKLLEYNVRFGDPETEALVPLYGDALFELLARVADGRIEGVVPEPEGAAVTVILAASGYPHNPRRGDVISGLGEDGQLAQPIDGVIVFHAGTQMSDEGVFSTAGGRVLAITGTGASIDEARSRAYQGAALVTFDGKVMRHDIALGAT
jgi:phosphoribosylamine--glycine ligase